MADVRVEDNTKACIDAMRLSVLRALEIIGGKAESYTKAITPKDTGALQNSFTHHVDYDKKQVTIGSNIEYAPYVELGTGKLYDPPPEWIEAQAKRGRGLDKWYYQDDQGKWHVGFPRHGAHMLQHGVGDHVAEYNDIIRRELSR